MSRQRPSQDTHEESRTGDRTPNVDHEMPRLLDLLPGGSRENGVHEGLTGDTDPENRNSTDPDLDTIQRLL
jgi:hypothetical protein